MGTLLLFSLRHFRICFWLRNSSVKITEVFVVYVKINFVKLQEHFKNKQKAKLTRVLLFVPKNL